MKWLCSVVCWMAIAACFAGTAVAETRTVELATYSLPDGWSTTENPGSSVMHAHVDQASGRWCQLVVWVSVDSAGNLDGEFTRDWENLVAKSLGNIKPATRGARAIAGWKGKSGVASFDNQFGKGTAQLVMYTNGSKRMSFSANTNAPAYYGKTIDAFFASIRLAGSGAPVAQGSGSDSVSVQAAPVSGGKTAKFDDGWVASEQANWVHLGKDGVVALIHHTLPDIRSFSNVDEATGYVWNQLVAPRYGKISNLWVRRSFWSDGDTFSGKYYAEGNARDAQGNVVFVALFRHGSQGRWIEIITSDKATFQRKLTSVVAQDGTNWEPLVKLGTYNKFQITPADLVGDWASGSGANVQYVDIYTGNNAGMAYASSTETYTFRKNGTYASTWKGAHNTQNGRGTQFAGASYKGTFKVNGWDVTLTGRHNGATHTFTSWFEAVKGGRVLHLYRGNVEEVHLIRKP